MSSLTARRGVRGGSSFFKPIDVPGLVLWISAERSRNVINGTTNISKIFDLSGNENNPVQATEAKQPDDLPIGIGGLRSVDFVAANSDALTITDAASIQNIWDGGGYAGGVVRLDLAGNAGGRYILTGSSWDFRVLSNEVIEFLMAFSDTSGAWRAPADAIVIGTPFIFSCAYDSDDVANNAAVSVNGSILSVSEASTPVGTRTTDAGSNKTIGNHTNGSRPFDGPYAELVLCNQPVSAANQTRLNNYFSRIYGIDLA